MSSSQTMTYRDLTHVEWFLRHFAVAVGKTVEEKVFYAFVETVCQVRDYDSPINTTPNADQINFVTSAEYIPFAIEFLKKTIGTNNKAWTDALGKVSEKEKIAISPELMKFVCAIDDKKMRNAVAEKYPNEGRYF